MKTVKTIALLCFTLLLLHTHVLADQRILKLKEGKIILSTNELFDLASKMDGILVIDVRGPKNYGAGHIPGAINIPGWKIEKAASLPENKDHPIACYCGSDKCAMSFFAADALQKMGYSKVFVYEQGVKGWKQEGRLPIPTELDRWSSIHTHDLRLMVQSGGPVILFDTRCENEYLNGSIYGAKNLSPLTINSENSLLPEDKSAFIVLFGSCPVDESPFVAANALKNLGYDKVRIYRNGYSGWQHNH